MKTVNSKIKFIFLVLSLTYYTTQLYAQTLTAANCAPIVGDSLPFQKATYAPPGSGGVGQFWDFSQIIHDGVPIVEKYAIPISLPTTTYYVNHTSNLKLTKNGIDYYLDSDSTGLYYLGTAGSINPYQGTITPISNRNVIMKFPFHIGDSSSSTTFHLIGSSFTYHRVKILADAYGTLVTPCGTYLNTLRVFRYDELEENPMSQPSHITYINTVSYEWYGPGIHGPILSINSSTNSSYLSTTTYNNWSIVYNDETKTPLGVKNYKRNGIDSFNFQNPTNNILNISIEDKFFSEYTLQIIDLSGKTILKTIFSEKTHSQDVSSISSGMYILQIRKEDGTISRKKLLIEH